MISRSPIQKQVHPLLLVQVELKPPGQPSAVHRHTKPDVVSLEILEAR